MKLGVVSDVHNGIAGLTYALENLRGCEAVLSLGDLVSDYRVTPATLRLAEAAGLVGIAGNHEKTILLHPGSRLRDKLASQDLRHLQALPATREFDIEGRHMLMVHGAPWDDAADYRCTYLHESDTDALARLRDESMGADLVLLGHTHVPMAVRVGRTLALNPGSCTEFRDSAQRLTYAELDFSKGLATIFLIKPGLRPEAVLSTEF